jgi:hypothetical protein
MLIGCSSIPKSEKLKTAIGWEKHYTSGDWVQNNNVINSFKTNCEENGMITQGLISLALSMRWQHSKIVNMPRYTGKGDIRDGKWIRECLIPPPGYKIVQADLSGIESRTSDHYTFHINPQRIEKTKKPYFDPHTEISVFAGLMTPEEETFYIYKSNNVKEDIKSY